MINHEIQPEKEEVQSTICIKLDLDLLKSIEELKRQWGLSSQSEAIERLLKMVLSSDLFEPED